MTSGHRAFVDQACAPQPLGLVHLSLLLSLVACGSSRPQERVAVANVQSRAPSPTPDPVRDDMQSHAPPPTPDLTRDAVIEGELVDSKTRERLVGGTIIAKPLADDLQETLVISDDAGRYKLAVPAGMHHVIVYYADTKTDLGTIDVKANEVVRLDIEIDHDAMVAAKKAAAAPPCPPVVGQPPVTSADIDKLAADVLASARYTRPNVQRGPIFVASNVDGPVRLTTAAVPKGHSNRFALRTMQELQAEADRRGTELEYIRFTTLEIAGACATVDIGVDTVSPSYTHDGSGCCCNSIDVYDKRNGRWVFRTTVSMMCP